MYESRESWMQKQTEKIITAKTDKKVMKKNILALKTYQMQILILQLVLLTLQM